MCFRVRRRRAGAEPLPGGGSLHLTDGMTLTVSPCGLRTGWGASAAEMASRCGDTCPTAAPPRG